MSFINVETLPSLFKRSWNCSSASLSRDVIHLLVWNPILQEFLMVVPIQCFFVVSHLLSISCVDVDFGALADRRVMHHFTKCTDNDLGTLAHQNAF